MSNQRLFFLEKNGKEFRMKYLRRLLLVLLALLFMVSACFVGRYIWQSFQTQRDFQQLQEEKSKNRDLKALWNRNPDLIGWISIAGTEIDYPVMQTKEEPEFYLRRNFKKEYSLAETPFLDAASDVALPTSNWLLYGHNMQDGTMFHDLLNYMDEEYLYSHQNVTVYTEEHIFTYRIFAAVVYDDRLIPLSYNFTEEGQRQEFLDSVFASSDLRSQFAENVEVTAQDKLLTLSTCIAGEDHHRFLVEAVLTDET